VGKEGNGWELPHRKVRLYTGVIYRGVRESIGNRGRRVDYYSTE
jgi:hypothetical protein